MTMKFEIVNKYDKVVHNISLVECLPSKEQINSMLKAGYTFKLDGKILTKKKLYEFLSMQGEQK